MPMPRVLRVTVKWFPLDDVSCGIAEMVVWMSSIHLGINSYQFKQALGPLLAESAARYKHVSDIIRCRLERSSVISLATLALNLQSFMT